MTGHSPQLARLGALAERYFRDDPAAALIKLRQFGELTAKEIAARQALLPAPAPSFDDVLRTLRAREVLPRQIAELFFHLKRVALPPSAEQRRIVAKLDALTARLARAQAELDQVPVLAAKLRETAFQAAHSGTLVGDVSVQLRPAEHWLTSTFYGPRFGKEEYTVDGVPTARTTDFAADGTMTLDDAPRVDCSMSDFAKWGLTDGDLLVTRTGAIGKCAIYLERHGPVLPSAYLIRVRFDGRIVPRFAWMMFASPAGQKHLGVSARSAPQPNINAAAIRSPPVPDLSLDQQRATIEAVDEVLARADRLEAEAAQARALLDRMEAAILARAFRGELVPQDPADEPASVLLDHIRAARAAAPPPRRGRRPAAA